MSRSQATTLRKLIEASKGILTAETLSSVMHYYEHGEYEMAYEGLVLELIRSGKHPPGFDFLEWKNLAVSFNLDNDPVFDRDFWGKFVEWGRSYD